MENTAYTPLLQQLLSIASPSGHEAPMRDWLILYFTENAQRFRVQPVLLYGEGYQDCLAVVFGKPRTAVFAHMDTTGFMVRYGQELICIGGPETETGWLLSGQDSQGPVQCSLLAEEQEEHQELHYDYTRAIDRGTPLVFSPGLKETDAHWQSPYLDNRIGLLNALLLAETLENGMLIFTCWEEHHGGSAAYMARMAYEHYGIRQSLISDVTWVTHGIMHQQGAVISLRDAGIPRRSYVDRIMELARQSGIPFQMEVEQYGSSDGGEIQRSPYPMDWCFVGAPISHMHSPNELIRKSDFEAMVKLYRYLMEEM